MKRLSIALALFLLPLSAGCQVLWRDVQAGTTIEQVKMLVPDANEPSRPSTLAGGAMIGLLELDGFQLADLDFKATFYFKDGKVDRVFLKPVERPNGTAARVAALKVKDGLLAKYGKPVSDEEQKGILGVDQTTKWLSGETIIRYSFTQYGNDGTGFLQVIYMVPDDTRNL
ncbi:MAG TPA: hypothetical protein VJM34_13865 [Novosphingobium sp.]|nr:hypothetical protein [Novosphingobium sp.]